MEYPTYDDVVARQNHMYATDVLEKFADRPKDTSTCLTAITEAFILGAGGCEGSFDAAIMLDYGGLTVLLEHLGVADIDLDHSGLTNEEDFERTIRGAVDFGASYDTLEGEIPVTALSDAEITGNLIGPVACRFNLHSGTSWRSE